jgi:hypothetical protein
MTKDEILKSVKQLFGMEKSVFAEAVLKNGVKVMTPGEFEVDAELFVVGEDENVPAPDGEHELENGSIIVSEGGLIKEIKAAEVDDSELKEDEEKEKEEMESDEKEKEEMESEDEKDEKDLKGVIEALVKRMDLIEEKLNKDEEKYTSEFDNVKNATLLLTEAFKDTPAGEKIELKKVGYSQEMRKPTNRKEKIEDLINFVNKKF